ncbi:MAG: serine/threonine-protein kinase [Candidatus Brocadiia bacterium]
MANDGKAQLQDLLGEYWVGKLLGTGARSEVYEVKRKNDGRVFAAKFIPVRHDEDKKVIRHLENEYQVLCATHRDGDEGAEVIVRPEDFRKVRKFFSLRAAYLIEERAYGQSLDEERDYELYDVLTIFRRVCVGLEHLHSVGYVHADLKPHNILVAEDLTVKLIDFGFAAPVGTKLTAAKGTFGYLAPEQAGGKVTERTDVFNLGGVLYWVLTGQNIPSIMPGQHERAGFVPDAQVQITPPVQLNHDVPGELSDMVLKCLSFNDIERPTMTKFKRYLHGLQLRMEYDAV